MALLLRDRRFAFRRATLSAHIPDPAKLGSYLPAADGSPRWSLDLFTRRRTFDGAAWAPYLSHGPLRLDVRDWRRIVGTVIAHPGGAGAQDAGHCHLLVHEQNPESTLRFVESSGRRFRFDWQGLCHLDAAPGFSREVPFQAEGWATFIGVLVHRSAGDDERSVLDRLERHLDGATLRRRRSRGEAPEAALFVPHT